MTTITIKEDLKLLDKTEFDTLEEAYFAWLDSQGIPYFRPLKPDEITEKRKKDWDEVDKTPNEDFIDIR